MAKVQKKYSFSKAVISLENGQYIITEYEKDTISEYNLTNILADFLGKDEVTLTIGIDSSPTSLETK